MSIGLFYWMPEKNETNKKTFPSRATKRMVGHWSVWGVSEHLWLWGFVMTEIPLIDCSAKWVQEKRKKRKRVHWVCLCSVHTFNNQMTLYREYVWHKCSLFAWVMWNRRCITSSVPLAVFLCVPSPSFASFVFVWTWQPTCADPPAQLTSIHYLTTSSITTRLSSALSARLSETLSGNSASALILRGLNFDFSCWTVTTVTTIIHCWADVLKKYFRLKLV